MFLEFKLFEVLVYINCGLINIKLGKYVIMFGGVIDLEKNSLIYSIGGYLLFFVLFVEGQVSYLEGCGLLVGLFDDVIYDDWVMELLFFFSLLLFFDGIFDVLLGVMLKEKEVLLLEQVVVVGGIFDGLCQVFGLVNLVEMLDDIVLLVLSRNFV